MTTRETLRRRHGTPKEFAAAVYAALGEISVDEANIAIRKYQDEWDNAITQPCSLCGQSSGPKILMGNSCPECEREL
jgi:hypothetical protein